MSDEPETEHGLPLSFEKVAEWLRRQADMRDSWCDGVDFLDGPNAPHIGPYQKYKREARILRNAADQFQML